MSKLTALAQDIVDSAYGDCVHPEVQENVTELLYGIQNLERENKQLREGIEAYLRCQTTNQWVTYFKRLLTAASSAKSSVRD